MVPVEKQIPPGDNKKATAAAKPVKTGPRAVGGWAEPALEVGEEGLVEAEDGREDEIDEAEAEEEKADGDVEAVLVVEAGGVVGEIEAEDFAAVEGGQRHEVEGEEEDVDEDAHVEEKDDREQGREVAGRDDGCTEGEERDHGERGGGGGTGVFEDDEEDEADRGGEELGDGAGDVDEIHLIGPTEVAVGHGDVFAPADDEGAAEEEEKGPKDGAPEIVVAEGVEGDAAEHFGGRVAEAIGGEGFGGVVDGDREDHDEVLEEG